MQNIKLYTKKMTLYNCFWNSVSKSPNHFQPSDYNEINIHENFVTSSYSK